MGRVFLNSQGPNYLDLFCGIGGLTIGLERAGLCSVGGLDSWGEAADTYGFNLPDHKCMIADIATVATESIEHEFSLRRSDVEIIVGGPPCQGFSTVGKRSSSDPRNKLWENFVELVDEFRPAYVLIENVEGLLVMGRGQVASKIIESFADIGYHMKVRLLRAADYGVPQLRKRVFFLGWLDGLAEPYFPKPLTTPYVTVADAILDLPALKSGESADSYTQRPTTPYQRARRGKKRRLANHEAANHPPHLVELLSHIPDGGNRKSIPPELQPKSGFHNSYARLASNKPAIAVTSNMRKPSSARATHPIQSRGLTVREGLRLQSFDDWFVPIGSRTSQYLQVGNAVPPLLAEAVGRELVKAFVSNTRKTIIRARKRPASKVQTMSAEQLELNFS